MPPKLFPTVMFILSVIAALNYTFAVFVSRELPIDDWRKILYWTAAAMITFSVTY